MTSTVRNLYKWHFLYQVPADLMTVKASQSKAYLQDESEHVRILFDSGADNQ